MTTIQIALRLGVMPSQIENEPAFWVNRMMLYFEAESLAEEIK